LEKTFSETNSIALARDKSYNDQNETKDDQMENSTKVDHV